MSMPAQDAQNRLRILVPFVDLRSEHDVLRSDLLKAWNWALDTSSFVGGAAVERFEQTFASFCQASDAIGVANGTDALVLALKALGIREGDEVITAVNSFVGTAEAIVNC